MILHVRVLLQYVQIVNIYCTSMNISIQRSTQQQNPRKLLEQNVNKPQSTVFVKYFCRIGTDVVSQLTC